MARRELVLSKQTLLRSNETSCQETKLEVKESEHKKNEKRNINEDSFSLKTSRLGGIGRVGSPAPMFIEQWYLLGKGHAMVEGGMVG